MAMAASPLSFKVKVACESSLTPARIYQVQIPYYLSKLNPEKKNKNCQLGKDTKGNDTYNPMYAESQNSPPCKALISPKTKHFLESYRVQM